MPVAFRLEEKELIAVAIVAILLEVKELIELTEFAKVGFDIEAVMFLLAEKESIAVAVKTIASCIASRTIHNTLLIFIIIPALIPPHRIPIFKNNLRQSMLPSSSFDSNVII
jgi:hypothetical protein